MKLRTREWVAKAEDDYDDARRILRVRKRVDFSNACFHAQQCAEKYMKAVLSESGKRENRIHDLTSLLDDLCEINLFWDALREAAKVLTHYAVHSRYPDGGTIDKAAAKSALAAGGMIRTHLREHLRLDVGPKQRAKPKARRKRKKASGGPRK